MLRRPPKNGFVRFSKAGCRPVGLNLRGTKNFRAIQIYAGLCLATVATLTGCAGGPASSSQVPSWVLGPPLGDKLYEYFVGSGSDQSGDAPKAEAQATSSLLSEVVRFLGVRITATSTATARSSLDSFRSDVIQQVRQSGEARIKGFDVVDRYIQRRSNAVSVYILARYNRQDLIAEQSRLAALFHEQVEAIAGPERDGDQLLAVGDVYRAVQKYIEAASAAASSTLENAGIQFRRAVNKATDALSRLSLRKLNDNLTATVAQPFAEDFLARAEVSGGGSVTPAAALPLVVSYETRRGNGTAGIDRAIIRTDRNGVARFTHPMPSTVGSATLTMRVDFESSIRILDALPQTDQQLVDGLRQAISSARLSYSYLVVSRAKAIPLSVVVLDTDIAGNPTGRSDTASGVEQALSQAGFTLPVLQFDAQKLSGRSDAEIIADLRNAVSQPGDRRVAYGVVAIEEFNETDGYIVKVGGTLKVADLASGRILYSRTLSTRSRADNASTAISAAFGAIGRTFGKDIARSLP